MGRRIGGHTDRDAFRAVDQEIGDPDRQDGGFLFRLVKIGDKIHHIPVQVRQKGFLGDLFQPGLCITHGGGPVAFDVAKVPVAVDQGQLLFEILGHHDQGVIDGAVTVGMVFTHGIADDPGRFPVGPVGPDAQLVHGIQGPSLDRLQAVPDIRQGPGHDNAHGIVDVGLLHEFGIF